MTVRSVTVLVSLVFSEKGLWILLPAAWGLMHYEFLPLRFWSGLLQVYPDILDGCAQ
jgi:hypothetical protein